MDVLYKYMQRCIVDTYMYVHVNKSNNTITS